MKKIRYIKKELIKIYGKEKTAFIIESAEKHYQECLLLCKGAYKGEYSHLEDTILPNASIYKALLEVDKENALKNVSDILIGLCEQGGKALNLILKFPGMKSVFMKVLPKAATKIYGRECGFDYENLETDKKCFKMDMIMCPYLKYSNILKVPELAPLFCDTDFATYGHLSGILFTRTETLGTGGSKCDFKFIRTDK